jgi:sulfide dehydrogenase cytochrome subunit
MRKSIAIAAALAALAAGVAIAQTPGSIVVPQTQPATTPTPPAINPAAAPAMAAAPGNVLSATCSGCHGQSGRSVAEIPAINGKTALQIQTAMLEFKTDRRPATVMNRHAKGFSDEEIAILAAYIAANWR